MSDNAIAPASGQATVPEILVEGHRTLIYFMDRIFGSYCVLMTALAGLMLLRGDGSPLTVALLVVFSLVNVA
ncbi:MAG TPA: hypothetical protein VD886_24610, partial [Herpetosiphonaceae bacterium]|nr:hypothetical protein [Herpetosiphonaceae bacterium]